MNDEDNDKYEQMMQAIRKEQLAPAKGCMYGLLLAAIGYAIVVTLAAIVIQFLLK